MQGDIRLVPLQDFDASTSPCDDIHFGGVEIYNDGQWGRICGKVVGREPGSLALEAQVACRQLGFPFGGLIDVQEGSRTSGKLSLYALGSLLEHKIDY